MNLLRWLLPSTRGEAMELTVFGVARGCTGAEEWLFGAVGAAGGTMTPVLVGSGDVRLVSQSSILLSRQRYYFSKIVLKIVVFCYIQK
jgi:hypothetical protein